MKKLKLLAASLITLLSSSCVVYDDDIKLAVKACENNGGIKFIYGSFSRGSNIDLYCNNGSRIVLLRTDQNRKP